MCFCIYTCTCKVYMTFKWPSSFPSALIITMLPKMIQTYMYIVETLLYDKVYYMYMHGVSYQHSLVTAVFFSSSVRRGDVLAAWSGIRPLVFDPNKADTQSVARNHVIEVRDSQLITISGGTFYARVSLLWCVWMYTCIISVLCIFPCASCCSTHTCTCTTIHFVHMPCTCNVHVVLTRLYRMYVQHVYAYMYVYMYTCTWLYP